MSQLKEQIYLKMKMNSIMRYFKRKFNYSKKKKENESHNNKSIENKRNSNFWI